MTYANGRLPGSALTTVESGIKLSKHTAPVYRAFRMYAEDRKRNLTIAAPGGGYRSYAMQDAMHLASLAGPAQRRKWGLSTSSTVPVAAAGYSTHGWEQGRMDLVGTDLSWILDHAGMFGLKREFGANDPNHFIDQGNSRFRHSVGATGTVVSGSPGKQPSNCWRRLQLLARLGGYTGPIDGWLGENSYAGLRAELKVAVDIVPPGTAGVFFALQRWAGVPTGQCVSTSDWRKIPRSNWRAIARKLNHL